MTSAAEHRVAPVIRRATPADLDFVDALERASFASERLSRRQWRRHLSSSTAEALIAEVDGRPVAALLALHPRVARRAVVYSIATRAEARGGGVGRALLDAACARARALGYPRIILQARVGDPRLRTFYERAGFTLERIAAGFYTDGEDALVMARPLAL